MNKKESVRKTRINFSFLEDRRNTRIYFLYAMFTKNINGPEEPKNFRCLTFQDTVLSLYVFGSPTLETVKK